MEDNCTNIYKKARNIKRLTQEGAAELLSVSVDAIKKYETDKTPVPNAIAADMAEIYDAKWLLLKHCRENPVGKLIIPEFNENANFSNAILGLLKEVGDVVKCREELIDIGADGVIDESERERFENIIKELDDVKKAILTLQFAKKE